jgi:hypothetical protein
VVLLTVIADAILAQSREREGDFGMTQGQLYRLSGLGLLAGAVLSAISTIVSGVVFPDTNDPAVATNPVNALLGVVGVIGAILALFGLPGMYVYRAREGGLVWLIGVLLIGLTAVLFGIFLSLTFVLVFPAIAAQAPNLLGQGPPPAFFSVFIIGTLANVLGAVLMGLPMLTRRIYPRWCGWLLVLEAVLAAVSFVVNGPSSSGVLSQIVNIISPLPLFVVLGWIGYELWAGRLAPAQVMSSAVTPQPA